MCLNKKKILKRILASRIFTTYLLYHKLKNELQNELKIDRLFLIPKKGTSPFSGVFYHLIYQFWTRKHTGI